MKIRDILENDDEEHRQVLAQTGFWGNKGAGAIVFAKDTGRMLMPFRSAKVQEPHTWGTWGGAIDQNEDPKQACLRELREESGFSGDVISITHLYRFTKEKFQYDTFAIIVDSEFVPQLDWETEKAKWMNDWPSPLHFGLQAVLSDNNAMKTIEKIKHSISIVSDKY